MGQTEFFSQSFTYSESVTITTKAGTKSSSKSNDESDVIKFNRVFFDYENGDATDLEQNDGQEKMTAQESLEFLRNKSQEMKEKLMNGETEDKIQIGSTECTGTEWKEMLKKIDNIIDDVKDKMREEQKKREENELKKDAWKKKALEESMIKGETLINGKKEENHDPEVPQFVQAF